MMVSFLPVIVSRKNKQTNENMSFIAVYQKFTLILKKHEKITKMTSLDVPLIIKVFFIQSVCCMSDEM